MYNVKFTNRHDMGFEVQVSNLASAFTLVLEFISHDNYKYEISSTVTGEIIADNIDGVAYVSNDVEYVVL